MNEIMKAIVIASATQLSEIGVDEPLSNCEVEVYDIDKYTGMYSPCSKIVWLKEYDLFPGKKFQCDFIVPTRWLKFD